MGINKEFNTLDHQRGVRAEQAALDACYPLPPWVSSVRLATREEDKRGIDIVAMSDIGPLYLQIKSSQAGKADFHKKARNPTIVVVVVNQRTQEKTRARVLSGLHEARKRVLALRGGT